MRKNCGLSTNISELWACTNDQWAVSLEAAHFAAREKTKRTDRRAARPLAAGQQYVFAEVLALSDCFLPGRRGRRPLRSVAEHCTFAPKTPGSRTASCRADVGIGPYARDKLLPGGRPKVAPTIKKGLPARYAENDTKMKPKQQNFILLSPTLCGIIVSI